MASFNKVILIGNMTADPELKQTPGGKSVCSFSIAVNRRSKEDNACDFINVVAWEKRADFVAQWFKKGNPILVCGQLQTRSYQDKQGNNRTVTEVLADELTFIASAPKEGAADKAPSPAAGYIPDAYTQPAFNLSKPIFEDLPNEEGLPF